MDTPSDDSLKSTDTGAQEASSAGAAEETEAEIPRRTPILYGSRQSSGWSRVVAKGIDMLVVVAAYFLLSAVWHPLGIIASAIVAGFQDAIGGGQSIGKNIIGLIVVDEARGLPVGIRESLLRNFPFVLLVLLAWLPVVWVFAWLICLPVIAFEIYLIFAIETGTRVGDVLGNTVVKEAVESPAYPAEG